MSLYGLLRGSTVKVCVEGSNSWGTAFFVSENLLLTCFHVVRNWLDKEIEIWWKQNKLCTARVVPIDIPPQLDVAVLRVEGKPLEKCPPCAVLGDAFRPGDPLYIYGYSDLLPEGDPVSLECEGQAQESGLVVIKAKGGQVRPGHSGSPILNIRTGKVCGIISDTRNRINDLGGIGIPIASLWQWYPELKHLNEEYQRVDSRWSESKPRERQDEEGNRRLDGAMPSRSILGELTEVRLLIALQNSPGLKAYLPSFTLTRQLVDKRDVAQSSLPPIEFPADAETGKLQPTKLFFSLTAPSFLIREPDGDIEVKPFCDSGVLTFFLTPQEIVSQGRVLVDCFKDAARCIRIGSLSLMTQVVAGIKPEPIYAGWALANIAIGKLLPRADLIYMRQNASARTKMSYIPKYYHDSFWADSLESQVNSSDVIVFKQPEQGEVLVDIVGANAGRVNFNNMSWKARSFLDDDSVILKSGTFATILARTGNCLLVVPPNFSLRKLSNLTASKDSSIFSEFLRLSYNSLDSASHIIFDDIKSGIVQEEIKHAIPGRVLFENVSWRAKIPEDSNTIVLRESEIVNVIGREFNVLLVVAR
jgi:membrane protein implicated in regulation of membrane protease activity